MKDKSNTAITLNKNLVHTLLKDMLRFPKGTFDNEINGLLRKIATNRVLCDILLMYQSTLDAGYTFPIETQELVFNNTFVDNESDAETLLTLYMNIRAAGIIPNANAVSLMVHVILLREDSNVVSTLSLNERLECVLEIFHDSIACNNPLRPFALRLLLTKLKFAGRLADVDRIYNIAVDLNEHSLELDGGYISTLAQQGKLDEAFSLWKKMISNTFHLQPDGSYAGPQGERLFDIKMESISEDYYKIQNYMLARLNDESNDPMPTPADILKINTDNDIKLHYESTTVRTPDTASTASDTDCNTVCVKSNSIDIYPMTTATEDLIVAYRQKKTIKNVYIIYGMLHKLKCVNHRIIPGYIRMLFERQDYQACLETMNDIIKFKIPFNILTTLNYCKVYIVLNDLKKAERILDMYMATRCYTAHLERNTDLYKAEPMYLILAYEYTMAGQLEDAKRMFSKCDINELRTKEMTAGLLIMTYIEQNSVEKLKSLLKFIDEHQIVLHDNHYTMILAFFGKSAQIDQVLYWYTRVCAIGLEKDIFIITCLIQAYSYCNRCDMAIEFYRTARRKYGYYVNNTILSVLCDVSGYHKSIADLEQIWQDGITDKVKPNENNYAAFAEAYWRIGFTEKAVNVLLKEMPRAGFAPNYIMLLTLIKVTKRNGPSQMYHRLLQAMKKWYHNKHQIMNINEWVDEESRQKEYIEDIKKYAM
ncbi:hypothetical protein BDF19DRAFT_316128 [Syncephalis fuscata]|nr:hypothetical protein BDF19DRAFT_316128 [Syncephalis fuscata]